MHKISKIETPIRPRIRRSQTCDLALSAAARKELRAQISPLSFHEARREIGPVYEIALRELYEKGCTNAARYFEQLMEKENRLIEEKRIGVRVRKDPNLIYAIVENIRSAEIAIRLVNGGGMEQALKLFYQTLSLLEEHESKYEWLVGDAYAIIIDIVDRKTADEPQFQEYKARIYTGYGHNLSKSPYSIQGAIERLTQAMNIARGSSWSTSVDNMGSMPLDQSIAIELCEILQTYARKIRHTDLVESLEYAQRAVRVISDVGISANKKLFCKASLLHSEILRKSGSSETALKVLCKIQKTIATSTGSDYLPIRSALFLQQSLCFYQLENDCHALNKARQSVDLSGKCGQKALKGKGLIQLGKIYAAKADEENREKARLAFDEARMIFAELKDMENEKRAKYLSAKIFSDKMFPSIVKLIHSSKNDFNDLTLLRRWKDCVIPFWQEEKKSDDQDTVNESDAD